VNGFRIRRWLGIVLVVPALAAVLLLAAAYGYAYSQRDVLARGIHVGTTDVGGLSVDSAGAKLARAYRPLTHPLVLRFRGRRVVLTAHETRVSLETKALLARALHVSRQHWFLARAWRELTGGRMKANLRLRVAFSRPAIQHVVRELQRRIRRPPVNAVLVPSFNRLTVRSGHRGVAVATRRLRHEIAHALVTRNASRLIDVPIRHPRPRVTVASLRRRYPSFITIDRSAFTLRVYGHLKLVRSYPIAVGQVGLQTPAGLYHIQDKVVNPSWQVPFSSWTGSLAGRLIPPGPDDPLKARWLGIFNGAGIHGTDETWSIGHAVSHGCVRMTIPDVIDLYDRVSVGTPVYIGD
jgi:lipoprotein-anchoring transpeptidase ErfK/SrfK